jgi:N-methylhydantoinase A
LNETTGTLLTEKCLTTSPDPSVGFLHSLTQMKLQAGEYFSAVAQIAHASTLVANAIIERKGARCALLCTKGFRDILEVRRHVRVTTYELWSDPPEPLVPRYLRLPVDERTRADGTIITPVRQDELAALANTLRAERVESIAIVFLHSYVNPANELEAKRILQEFLPAVPITTSASVLPQIKEYERTSTTVVNAYVRPLVEKYISNLASRFERAAIEAPFYIMLSNGGVASPKTAQEFPVRLIESGPVAGAKVVQHFGRQWGIGDALAFDMGGTTAKACLIQQGEIPITHELEVARSQRFTKLSGYPIAVPGAHLIEIGAGGGSIARVNSLGLVQVGPESASSQPGPACYGRGGTEPTVTDADLILGYLDPDYFAGGTMPLHAENASAAIARTIGDKTGRDPIEAAWAIHNVVNETMAAAIRMYVAERGGIFDGVTLVAFGGAGPVHADNLARKLGVRKFVVPLRAGVLSAVGLVLAPPVYDIVKTYRVALDHLDAEHVERAYRDLESEVAKILLQVERDGRVTFFRSIDVGYIGQGYQVTLPVTRHAKSFRPESVLKKFAGVYREKYGYYYDDVPAEIANIRVNGQIGGRKIKLKRMDASGAGKASQKISRPAYSAILGQMVEFAVYDRPSLRRRMSISGPAVIEEASSTTVVDLGARLVVDDHGSLVITVPETRR